MLRVWLALSVGFALLVSSSVEAKVIQPPRPAGGPTGVYLGVTVGQTQAAEPGLMIRDVNNDGPAAKAGLKAGDRVIKMDNQDLMNIDMFMQNVEQKKPGDKLSLRIVRAGQEQDINVTLGERPTNMPEIPLRPQPGQPGQPVQPGLRRPLMIGVQTMPLNPEMKNRLQIKADHGVVVIDVSGESPAAKAGLKRDDVITSVNGTNIQDSNQLRDLFQQNGAEKEATVQVMRGSEQMTLKVKPVDLTSMPSWNPQRPPMDLNMDNNPFQKIRDLERRLEDLERRVRELEGKKSPPPG